MAFDAAFEQAIAACLATAGLAGAERHRLAQDASTRSYERLIHGDSRAMLMLAPPGNEADGPCPPQATREQRLAMGWNAQSRLAASRVEAFVAVARHLSSLGLSAPAVLAADAVAGVAVLEDLGDGLYARLLAEKPDDEADLYAEAARLLAWLHQAPVPATLPSPAGPWPILPFDRLALEVNAGLFVDWIPRLIGAPAFTEAERHAFAAARDGLIDTVLAHRQVLVLRDYHAENLLWLPRRDGVARIGLLDFQDAVFGPRMWDMSMLLHDARRDVSPGAHDAALVAYGAALGEPKAVLEAELAACGALNTLRILGIFARLVMRDGKPRYRGFLPREVGHMRAILASGARGLGPLGDWMAAHAPLEAIAAEGRP